MKKPEDEIQVSKEHYSGDSYDTVSRFVSYFNQKELILKAVSERSSKTKILEIGKGNGFLFSYLKERGINIKTFDFADDLHPDYVGDVRQIAQIVKETFDVVACFEVLEHIPFSDLPRTINQLKQISSDKILISVPKTALYFSIWIKITLLHPISFLVSLPTFFRKHKFDGQHYWELGNRGSSNNCFLSLCKKEGLFLEKQFTDPQDPYRKYFVFGTK